MSAPESAHGMTSQTPTSLYRFFDVYGQLLYVGITERGAMRWSEHRKSKPWWTQVALIQVQHFTTRGSAASAELQAIRDEGPMYNIAGAYPDAPQPARLTASVGEPSQLLEPGEVVAILVEGRSFPPVGWVVAVNDRLIRLELYSWATMAFTAGTTAVRWDDVLDIVWAGLDPDGLFDMDPLADYQTAHDQRPRP